MLEPMNSSLFHPAVANWFAKQFPGATLPQEQAWPAIKNHQNTLIAAPTGSGKTLAAFLAAIDDLVRLGLEDKLDDTTHVIYVSPLKALSNDIQINLQKPLEGIERELLALGLPPVNIRTLVRTGDTPAAERTAMIKRPPHICVTTPESLYILLTSEGGRRMLRTARTLIVDEIHALVGDKRGSHLALSIERLEHLAAQHADEQSVNSNQQSAGAFAGERDARQGKLIGLEAKSETRNLKIETANPQPDFSPPTPRPTLVRIGLSATQRPIEEVARFLVGTANLKADGTPNCTIVDSGHVRRLDLAIEVPDSPLQAVMSGEVWDEVYDRLAQLIREHHTTLIFVNTRRLAERVARHLGERIGDENIAAHHGSLAREQRLAAELRLKAGELSALVATASLELGIDIGDVNLVCQLASTRSIASFLQRVGRSNHTVEGFPKGRIFPLSRDELVECAALIDSVRRGELDQVTIPQQPLDILAQQIVAAVAAEEWVEDDLFAMVRGAYPYRNLERTDFDEVVRMLAEGFATKRGRRSAYLHHDAVNHRLRGRRGARLAAITSGGAIPDTADYAVVLEPGGLVIGSVNEDFAIESLQGDIFQLGNTSWRVLRVEQGKVRVEDAHGQPPSIPFWLGEAPARTPELSAAVSRLREDVAARVSVSSSDFSLSDDPSQTPDKEAAQYPEEAKVSINTDSSLRYLTDEVGISRSAAEQIVEYLAASKIALGVMPTQQNIVLERFFDDSGSMQLIIHAPFGSRLNRAWGLALRKRFCRQFNFELQAAATEDAIVLSLGPTHSFPLSDVFHYLNSKTVRELLCQALLDAPMWNIRWRWNVTRALAVLRRRGGKKIPAQLQRMDAEDLLTAVFPDQVACVENLGGGPREIPGHPLVAQTVKDCLEEAMDIEGLQSLLQSIERNERNLIARDMIEASPLAAEILNARPYAYLDDAPLEERRTRAVFQRRWLDPEKAADIGKLDPAAIERVREEVWPEAQNPDELHDALVELGFLTASEGTEWQDFFAQLQSDRRAAVLQTEAAALWVAAERLPQLQAVFPSAWLHPVITAPESFAQTTWSFEDALVELVRGRLEGLGPVTAETLALSLGLSSRDIEAALLKLEVEGFVIRGSFTNNAHGTEWCARRLLARIHSYTLNRLRQEIEPVSSADFIRFLLAWQKVAPDHQIEGPDSLRVVLEQLEGFEAPAAAWEGELLPSRLLEYDPVWLDALCLSGEVMWARLTPLAAPKNGPEKSRGSGPVRTTPIAIVRRKNLSVWNSVFPRPSLEEVNFSTTTEVVHSFLRTRGASFFHDIVESTRLLRSQVEDALAELVAYGLITSDSFTGLRALLTPASRKTRAAARHKHRQPVYDMASAGRWSILPGSAGILPAELSISSSLTKPVPTYSRWQASSTIPAETKEAVARILLQRYGVVFKRLLEREGIALPWRDLLRVYHRLEARGEIRGGRFVAGISGEQFALPEAVALVRSIRRAPEKGNMISVSAADPLNLAGIITPGPRVTAHAANRVLYSDGAPVAALESGETRFLVEMSRTLEWQAKAALLRKATPPVLRSYLSRRA
ncbi:MAG: box helicase domain protein [Acidobacteria bacterium]|nr:box helicase domain protein [Acidobacteriota bacterium]